jgi:hypothetical protein
MHKKGICALASQLARSHASTLDRRRVDRNDYLPTASRANLRSMFSNACASTMLRIWLRPT